MRLRSPESLIRAFWDAVADTLVRSAAAPRTVRSPAFAAAEPTPVTDLAEWLADNTDGLSAGARLGLRVEAVPPPSQLAGQWEDEDAESPAAGTAEPGKGEPDEAVPAFRMVLQLRSAADPSLIVDAGALWDQPERVLARFGAQADTDLLLALRRGAAVWPPLGPLLEQASPAALELDDDAVASLLGPAAEELAGAGIEVLWPASLGDGLKLQAVPTPAPERLAEAGFSLDALLEFHWQLTLGGEALDAAEIAELAEAKRPLIRLRGRWVTLDPVVRETMAAIEAAEGIERAGLVFKLLTALKQICNHPAQYLKQPGPLAGRSGKLAAFDELADVILAGGESMLVFSQYTQMATLLQQHLDGRGVRSLFLHGGVPVRRREEMVEQFQAGHAPVFLLSLKAGGTGLTLTRATHVLHYDRWWNPAVEDQATDRAHRIGQDRPVQVHRLIAEGTLEDRIASLLDTKRQLADAVVGSGEGWIAELPDDQLAELVSLRAAS